MTLSISYSQRNFTRNGSQDKMLRIDSHLSEKHPWTTATPKSILFAFTRLQHVSLACQTPPNSCHVWNPHVEKDKKAIENVQTFTCRFATAPWTSYESLLELLNLQPLQECRTHARLGLLYRFLYKFCITQEVPSIYDRTHYQVKVPTN